MKYVTFKCDACEISCGIEFDQEEVTDLNGDDKPVFCPFCGEELDQDLLDDEEFEEE